MHSVSLGKCKFKTFISNYYLISYKSSPNLKKIEQNAIKKQRLPQKAAALTIDKTEILFFEVTVEETLESLSVASFILCHFMNGVMDSIVSEFFGATSYTHLVGIGSGFCCHTLFKVGFGVPYNIAEKFSEFRSMFSFFPSVTLECFSDFRISFAVSLA